MPGLIRWLLLLAVGSSFLVAHEPAPTDALFLLLPLAIVALCRIRFPLHLNPLLEIGLIAFVVGSTLSLFSVQADMGQAIFYYAVTLYLLVSWYVVITLLANYGESAWKVLFGAFLLAAALAALVGLITHFTPVLQDQLGLPPMFANRSRGTFKDPNVYAPFLCAGLMLVVNAMVARSWLSPLAFGLAGLFMIEIVAAFSRGGYVNLVVAFGLYVGLVLLLQRKSWLLRLGWLSLFGLIVVVPMVVYFLSTTGLEQLLAQRLKMQSYDTERFVTQSAALEAFGEHFFGIGPGQSERMFELATHNLYLRVFAENGLFAGVGLILFAAVTLWICLQHTFRRGPFQDLYACSFAILSGILVNSLVIDSLHWRHFFLFLALPVGLALHERWYGNSAQARLAESATGIRLTAPPAAGRRARKTSPQQG